MEGLIECLVKRKLPLTSLLFRICMIVATAVVPVTVLILTKEVTYLPLVIIVGIVMVVLTYIVFRRTNVEFEYAYFEGELTVDKIMSRSSRKRLGTFDFTKLEYIAPANSPRLFGAKNRKQYNYTTLDPNQESYAALVMDSKNEQVVLLFTPNEELMEAFKRAFPRKIYAD